MGDDNGRDDGVVTTTVFMSQRLSKEQRKVLRTCFLRLFDKRRTKALHGR